MDSPASSRITTDQQHFQETKSLPPCVLREQRKLVREIQIHRIIWREMHHKMQIMRLAHNLSVLPATVAVPIGTFTIFKQSFITRLPTRIQMVWRFL